MGIFMLNMVWGYSCWTWCGDMGHGTWHSIGFLDSTMVMIWRNVPYFSTSLRYHNRLWCLRTRLTGCWTLCTRRGWATAGSLCRTVSISFTTFSGKMSQIKTTSGTVLVDDELKAYMRAVALNREIHTCSCLRIICLWWDADPLRGGLKFQHMRTCLYACTCASRVDGDPLRCVLHQKCLLMMCICVRMHRLHFPIQHPSPTHTLTPIPFAFRAGKQAVLRNSTRFLRTRRQ